MIAAMLQRLTTVSRECLRRRMLTRERPPWGIGRREIWIFGYASGPKPAKRRKSDSPHERYVVTSLEDRKRAASARVIEFVQQGIRVGLGAPGRPRAIPIRQRSIRPKPIWEAR
jgi:hypothetical protein